MRRPSDNDPPHDVLTHRAVKPSWRRSRRRVVRRREVESTPGRRAWQPPTSRRITTTCCSCAPPTPPTDTCISPSYQPPSRSVYTYPSTRIYKRTVNVSFTDQYCERPLWENAAIGRVRPFVSLYQLTFDLEFFSCAYTVFRKSDTFCF